MATLEVFNGRLFISSNPHEGPRAELDLGITEDAIIGSLDEDRKLQALAQQERSRLRVEWLYPALYPGDRDRLCFGSKHMKLRHAPLERPALLEAHKVWFNLLGKWILYISHVRELLYGP